MDPIGESGFIQASVEDGIAVLLLNRPGKLNALSVPMLKDVGEGLRTFGSGERANALVLTGAGRAFSAGDDLPATEDLTHDDFEELLSSFQELTRLVLKSKVPVIAALNGIAVGGAAELTLACDARVGHPGSDFLFPENDVGLTISNGSTYLLPRMIGGRALSTVLDGRRISGTEAHEIGLVQYFVESAEEVLPKAKKVVHHWVDRGLATPYHLQLLRPHLDEVEAAIARENEIGREAWEAGTAREGIKRFLREQEERRARR